MADRAHVIGLLQRELAAARDVRADAWAAELEQRIARLSQGSAQNPATEKATAARRPARSRS